MTNPTNQRLLLSCLTLIIVICLAISLLAIGAAILIVL
jgi:hypothetical protein